MNSKSLNIMSKSVNWFYSKIKTSRGKISMKSWCNSNFSRMLLHERCWFKFWRCWNVNEVNISIAVKKTRFEKSHLSFWNDSSTNWPKLKPTNSMIDWSIDHCSDNVWRVPLKGANTQSWEHTRNFEENLKLFYFLAFT